MFGQSVCEFHPLPPKYVYGEFRLKVHTYLHTHAWVLKYTGTHTHTVTASQTLERAHINI